MNLKMNQNGEVKVAESEIVSAEKWEKIKRKLEVNMVVPPTLYPPQTWGNSSRRRGFDCREVGDH